MQLNLSFFAYFISTFNDPAMFYVLLFLSLKA